MSREFIPDPNDRKRPRPHRFIVDDPNTGKRQPKSETVRIGIVMISENCEDPERGPKLRQRLDGGPHRVAAKETVGEEVSRKQDYVGPKRVHANNRFTQPLWCVTVSGHMEVGQQNDLERLRAARETFQIDSQIALDWFRCGESEHGRDKGNHGQHGKENPR